MLRLNGEAMTSIINEELNKSCNWYQMEGGVGDSHLHKQARKLIILFRLHPKCQAWSTSNVIQSLSFLDLDTMK